MCGRRFDRSGSTSSHAVGKSSSTSKEKSVWRWSGGGGLRGDVSILRDAVGTADGAVEFHRVMMMILFPCCCFFFCRFHSVQKVVRFVKRGPTSFRTGRTILFSPLFLAIIPIDEGLLLFTRAAANGQKNEFVPLTSKIKRYFMVEELQVSLKRRKIKNFFLKL